MDEQHVDVARVVELGAAELAHADDGERDRGLDDRERRAEAHLGERSELTADGREVGEAEEVARRDADVLASLPASQRGRRVGRASVTSIPAARRSSTVSSRARSSDVIGSSSEGSFTIAVVSARDAHASATSAARARCVVAKDVGDTGVGLDDASQRRVRQ